MPRRVAVSLCLISVAVLFTAFRVIQQYGPPAWSGTWDEALLKLVVWVAPSVLIVGGAYQLSPRQALAELGLWANPLVGCAIGVAATLPMLAWLSGGVRHLAETRILGEIVVGPFAEEVLFRGLLFRQLYRRAGRSPVRAMIVSALVFGFAHLVNLDAVSVVRFYQWHAAAALVGEATLGGLLFAWLTYRWNSLWPAIAVHASLNLSWDLTLLETNRLVVLTRVASVVIVLAVTWRATRLRAGRPIATAAV